MKFSERTTKQKARSQERLQRIVDEYRGGGKPIANSPQTKANRQRGEETARGGLAAASPAPAKKAVGRPVKKAPAPRAAGRKAASSKASAKGGARAVSAGSVPAPARPRLRDTISDYRSVPMPKRKRRRRTALFYGALGFLVAAVFVVLSLTVFFGIQSVSVEGNSLYTEAQVLEIAAIEPGSNLFRLDTAAVTRRLERELPYIKEAKVTRVLPDRVRLELVETRAVCAAADGGTYAILDPDGKVLGRATEAPAELALLVGGVLLEAQPGETARFEEPETGARLRSVWDALSAAGLDADVTAISVEKRYDLSFTYRRRIVCRLGVSDRLDTKMQMICAVIADNPEDVAATIDATDAQAVHYRPQFE